MTVDRRPAANGAGKTRIAEVFERHGRDVFRAAYRVTGNVADAEDVLQSVFAKACRRVRDGGDGSLGDDPGRYLGRAAVNGALDLLRRRRPDQMPGVLDSTDAEAMPAAAGPGVDAEAEVRRERLRTRLRAALATLSPDWAQMVALRYFEGLTNVEIAKLVDTSPAVVRVTLHRARRRLRDALADLERE